MFLAEWIVRASYKPLGHVPSGGGTQCFAEHDDKTTRIFITQIGGNRLNGCSLGEPLQSQDDVKLLPPAAETHSGLLNHESAERAFAEPDSFRPLMYSRPVGRVGCHPVCNPPQTAVRRHREMQLFHGRGGEFIEQDRHDTRFRAFDRVQVGKCGTSEQEFAQQGGDGNRAAGARQVRGGGRFHKQDVDIDGPDSFQAVPCAAGDPDGALRRHNPQTLRHLALQYAARHVKQLCLAVVMRIQLQPFGTGHKGCTHGCHRPRHQIRIDEVFTGFEHRHKDRFEMASQLQLAVFRYKLAEHPNAANKIHYILQAMNSLTTAPITDLLKQLFQKAEAADRALMEELSGKEFSPELIKTFLDAEKKDYKGTYRSRADNYLNVSPEFGKFLYMCARTRKAKRIIEFGTSFGISAIYLACAIRDGGGGQLIGTELEATKAAAARESLDTAGLSDFVDIRIGDALETLKDGIDGEVDLVHLDGAFSLYLPVLKLLEPHLKAGALVIGENAFDPVYLEYVRNPQNGFLSVELPFEAGRGNEFTVVTR
jgi:predicted O-methyltransferase YrrM